MSAIEACLKLQGATQIDKSETFYKSLPYAYGKYTFDQRSFRMKRLLIPLTFMICVVSSLAVPPASQTSDVELAIEPVVQKTPVWCWVAVGEMVFEHFGVPNVNPAGVYQCGIIGALAGPRHVCWFDCSRCNVPAGSPNNLTDMLRRYPQIAGQLTGSPIAGVRSTHTTSALTPEQIKEELDNDRPIIAGVNPAGVRGPFAQHVALIIGYEEDDDVFMLTVNDPYPYQFVGNRFDPYLRAGGEGGSGQYRISYKKFVRGLAWSESFYRLRQ